MRRLVTIITGFSLLVATGPAAAPAAGSPLLSGYGGPGTGAQQIIGAGLVNGGGGGSGPGTGGGGGATAGGQTPSQQASGGRSQRSPGTRSGNRRPSRRGGSGKGAATSNPSGIATTSGKAAVPSATLGLSNRDLAMVAILALCLLATAALTWWLVGLKPRPRSVDKKIMNLDGSH